VSPDNDHGKYIFQPWELMVGSDKRRVIACEASNRITATIGANYDNWQWTLTRPWWLHVKPETTSSRLDVPTLTTDGGISKDPGDSLKNVWQDHGECTSRLSLMTMDSDKPRETASGAFGKITATTAKTDREFWSASGNVEVATGKRSTLRI